MADWYDEREARARYLLGCLVAEIHSSECAAGLLSEAVAINPDLVEAHVGACSRVISHACASLLKPAKANIQSTVIYAALVSTS